jgi:hypothetical protein
MRAMGEDYFEGRLGKNGRPLNEVIAPTHVSFEEFLYITALVSSLLAEESFAGIAAQLLYSVQMHALPVEDQGVNSTWTVRPVVLHLTA